MISITKLINSSVVISERIYPFDILKNSITKSSQHGLMLDFGCGEGINMQIFSKTNQCIGIDISLQSLKMAKTYGPVILCNGEALPFKDNCFDIIISEHVLHHIDDISLAFAEIYRCLKVDGRILINDIVEDNPIIHMGRNLYPFYKGIPVKSRFYRSELLDTIQKNNFAIVSCGETKFESFFAWFIESKYSNNILLLKILHPFLRLTDILTEKSVLVMEYALNRNLSADCFCEARKKDFDLNGNINDE